MAPFKDHRDLGCPGGAQNEVIGGLPYFLILVMPGTYRYCTPPVPHRHTRHSASRGSYTRRGKAGASGSRAGPPLPRTPLAAISDGQLLRRGQAHRADWIAGTH
ncbi:hypothetical protein GGTG_01521 [Gaeumannomyces tritici R3-111a-1]|uniref:Uncharacterized protein n=1 Tax=Gaeumannomyces tritici (strain R3-111a-1) TaxID=644352 RepID=J3NJU0_GAET3|nr:hypothetical protein GGTG_01521 [Gaeumannomyces tritici R3-111a-1]EJT81543.1 hypothetical protein GGTG_01521 [Gaeumannomyces tritici R3-111a-1]